MASRLLTSAFVLGILLTQSASVLGHAHAGMNLKGHDSRAHLHTATFGCGHNHDETDPDDDTESDSLTQQEDDTFLVPSTDSLAGDYGSSATNTYSLVFLPPVSRSESHAQISRHIPRKRLTSHPPDYPWPLYVRHLALLI
jgi:hypothetical protein